jgi:uncharacterized RDD family membrane protein YckC
MIDPLSCPTCSFANAPGAESCVKCGTSLAETPDRVHPGETLRDPDDLTLPSSPLLRAVLRGESDTLATPRTTSPATTTPPAVQAPAQVETRAPAFVPTPAPAPRPVVTPMTVEHLSPTVDQAALLRELAERLHTRPTEAIPRYAGFFVRLGAFLIDSVVLAAFGVPLAAAGYLGIRAGMLVLGHGTPVELDESMLTLLTAAWFAMATVYFTVLHRSYGQTIGKSLFGIAVKTLDLQDIGVLRALVRTLGYAVSSGFLGFGFFLVALTPRKRGWHDFLARTCVVRLAAEEAA